MIICRSLVLDRKDRYLQYAMPTPEFFRDFLGLCALLMTSVPQSLPIVKEWQQWWHWTKNLLIHGHTLESILRQADYRPDLDYSTSPNQDEYWAETFFGRFFDTVVRMALRLMVSCQGRVGMVAQKAKKGDLICVLFGCSIPVLLRDSPDPGDESFELIGECYLDGFMDGSILEQYELPERTFLIR